MVKLTPTDSLMDFKDLIKTGIATYNQDGKALLKDIFSIDPEDAGIVCHRFDQFASAKLFEKYCICVIVMWAMAYKNSTQQYFEDNLCKRVSQIPQHSYKKYVETYLDTFHSYNLDTFGISVDTMENIQQIIILHSGRTLPTASLFS